MFNKRKKKIVIFCLSHFIIIIIIIYLEHRCVQGLVLKHYGNIEKLFLDCGASR